MAPAAAALGVLALVLGIPWWVPQVVAAVGPDRASLEPGTARSVVATAQLSAARAGVTASFTLEGPPVEYRDGDIAERGRPVRVRVPRLGIDAPVVPISGQSGELTPPQDPQLLGWWQEGREPGSPYGASVITGHTVHTGGGALDALGTLRRGDRFTVVTDQGEITYLVRWQHDYPTPELARRSARLFGQDDYHRLVLVTCSGWNGQGYDDSAVVLARPIATRTAAQGRR